jgi:DNA gyrase subunit A
VITIKNTAKLGDVVGIKVVGDSDHLLILTSGGRIIRLHMEQISVIGRNTMGRTLVRMDQGEVVVDVARAEPSEDEEKESDETEGELEAGVEAGEDEATADEAVETDEEP